MICRVSVHVFVDESRRGSTYLLAAALLDPPELGPSRVLLRGLRMPGERKLHFKHERTPCRRTSLPGWWRPGCGGTSTTAAVSTKPFAERACPGWSPTRSRRAALAWCRIRGARMVTGPTAARLSVCSSGTKPWTTWPLSTCARMRTQRCGFRTCSRGVTARAVTGGVVSRLPCEPLSMSAWSTGTAVPSARKREARVPAVRRALPGLTSSA